MTRTRLIFPLLLLLTPTFASAEAVFNEDYDEFTETDNSYVFITRSSGDDILIGWKCFYDGLNVVLTHDYLGGDGDDDVIVMYKFDDKPASGQNWYGLSPSNTITFFDMWDVADFTSKALASNRFLIRLIDPLDNETLTATFNPSGLDAALRKLKCT